MMYACSVIIMIYVVVNTIRELMQLYQQRGGYLFDPSNLVPWLLYFSAAATVGPMFAGRLDAMQISCASLMVFLAWFNLLLFLQRYAPNTDRSTSNPVRNRWSKRCRFDIVSTQIVSNRFLTLCEA